MSARARRAETAKAHAERVIAALVSEPDHFAGPACEAVADKILDDLRELVIEVSSRVGDVKCVTLTLHLLGATADGLLRASNMPTGPALAETTSYEDLAAGRRTFLPTDPAAPGSVPATWSVALTPEGPDPAGDAYDRAAEARNHPAGPHLHRGSHVGPESRNCLDCPQCHPRSDAPAPDHGTITLQTRDAWGHHYLMPVDGQTGCDARLASGNRCSAPREWHLGTSPDPSE